MPMTRRAIDDGGNCDGNCVGDVGVVVDQDDGESVNSPAAKSLFKIGTLPEIHELKE